MQTLELVTKDQVKLRAFYFPSDKGKEAIPVILIHEWQGQAGPYSPLVKSLWESGCAVIVPELRGHGASKEQTLGGRTRELDAARMGKTDVQAMITGDLEEVKRFLVEENNDEKLNLNALTLIGVREGAILAAHWAIRDLNFPSIGAIKQGQDVKSLILISPERLLKGITLDETLNNNRLVSLPFLIVVGQASRQASDTERFHRRLESTKRRMGRGQVQGLQYEVINTSLDGHALLNDAPGVIPKVRSYVVNEMVKNSSKFPWVERR